jgi:hypothetical protein
MSGPKPPLVRQGGGQRCPKCYTWTTGPGRKCDCRPPLKLKPFDLNAELTAAERRLGLKGLCQQITAAAKPAKLTKEELSSLLHFIAVSSYLDREKSLIDQEIKKILTRKNIDGKLNGLDTMHTRDRAHVQKAQPSGPSRLVFLKEDLGALARGQKTGTMLLQAGISTLHEISKKHGDNVGATAQELAETADEMGAKGYGRWVGWLTRKKQEAGEAEVNSQTHIILDEDSDAHDSRNLQLRWCAYPLDKDGDMEYVEKMPLTIGSTYAFLPPPTWGRRAFKGRLVSKDKENPNKKYVYVTEILPEMG